MMSEHKHIYLIVALFIVTPVLGSQVQKIELENRIHSYKRQISLWSAGNCMAATSVAVMLAGLGYFRHHRSFVPRCITIGSAGLGAVIAWVVRHSAMTQAEQDKLYLDQYASTEGSSALAVATIVCSSSNKNPYKLVKTVERAWPVYQLLPILPPEETFSDPNAAGVLMTQTGFSATQGLRESMEDTYCLRDMGPYGGFCAAVYDGHSGNKVADFAKQYLCRKLEEQIKLRPHEMEQALMNAFTSTHNCLPDYPYLPSFLSYLSYGRTQGATAIAAVVRGSTIYVANAGDSRAVVGSKSGLLQSLSVDHTPSREDEQRRIEGAGGQVGCSRKAPILRCHKKGSGIWLACTRALGDKDCNPVIIPNPEVQRYVCTKDDNFLIVASDGLWGMVSNKDAVGIVSKVLCAGQSAQDAAEALTKAALKAGSSDNITAIVIPLKGLW